MRLLVTSGTGGPLQAAYAEWLAGGQVVRDLRVAVDIDQRRIV